MSSEQNDGGPAFPVPGEQQYEHPVHGVIFPSSVYGSRYDPGMTLRDWFAGQADIPWNVLHAMLVQRGEHEPTSGRVAEYRANMKYIEADAMLEARKPSA